MTADRRDPSVAVRGEEVNCGQTCDNEARAMEKGLSRAPELLINRAY